MLDIFLESNILIDHFCRAHIHMCSSELLGKVSSGLFKAWTSDYIFSETLGEMKSMYEKAKNLKDVYPEAVPRSELSRMTETLENFKKVANIDIIKTEIDQKAVYEKVRDLCITTKDAPVVLSVLGLQEKINRQVKLVTSDMKLFVRAKRNVRTLHPSFHFNKCPNSCRSYYSCQERDKYTSTL